MKNPLFLLLLPLLFPSLGFSAEPIEIQNIVFERQSADQYVLKANVINMTEEPKDLILRAQLAFYEKASPEGDLPAMILRKDTSVVLKAAEERKMAVTLMNEGTTPSGNLRVVPTFRVRREREWKY